MPIYEKFVAALEGFLGVNRTEYDFYEGEFRLCLAHARSDCTLSVAHHAALGEYPPEYIGPAWSLLTVRRLLSLTWMPLMMSKSFEQWELVGKPFTADYQALNDGDLREYGRLR